MIDISALSRRYRVRRLDDSDADSILELCRDNAQYYLYCQAEPSKDQILNDLHITPPGIDPSDKYYVGFYQENTLLAVMDLIDGYPASGTAFIGFFMMRKEFQGKQAGSAIIQEASAYLKTIGMTAIQLGIDKGNPQSTHFWKKNGFLVKKEIDRGSSTVLLAEKPLA